MKRIMRLGLVGVAMLTAGIVGARYVPLHRGAATHPEDSAAGRPAPRCWEAMVYLPLADNTGRPFSEEAWQEALSVLVTPFGGATLGTAQEGCWLDARGRICREPVRPVFVSFAPDRLDEFRAAVRAVGQRLSQEAMYVRFEEPRVELIPLTGR